jgi:ElaB/YqjD/DUF883 family membrane-anchored ribosome-binding protein
MSSGTNGGTRLEDKASEAKRAARSFIDDATDRAGDAYGAAREFAASVEPFVKDRPYAALALAVFAGFVIGGLFLGRGPRVIYVKPRE